MNMIPRPLKSHFAATLKKSADAATLELQECARDVRTRHGTHAMVLAFCAIFWELVSDAHEDWVEVICTGARLLPRRKQKVLLEKIVAIVRN